ncbi:amidohydrolase [Pseudorhodoferax sp. Leaf267]|uniref:amidohydrolase family protein n=1 Tax=Pseudorhodoferax sp. Leaf267 TaxID=1736316 RepID=UPI0006F808FE|nr:amidohydrolase family protein [Pseudorhodoferax sp. Leaf267]KQP18313.1 amidohydrolase [Pseudorhodoferax sp. Leaf267]
MTAAPFPPGACDCHVHVYEQGFPVAPSAVSQPPHGPLSAYREVQATLGLQRVVLVQPTAYGFDNRCMLEALAQLGDTARGIAIVPPDASDAELQRLHAQGVRGVRYMTIPNAGGIVSWDSIEAMAARIAPLGWNLNLQLDGRDLPQRQAVIDRLPCKVVIDHNGKFLEPVAPEHPAFEALLAVLARKDRWIKLSAPYETSRAGPPGYDDVSTLARALVRAHPDRCLWASNWPHPGRVPPPSNTALAALLSGWAPDEAVRRAILVDNPAALYGF